MVLGGCEVKLVDHVGAFAVIANGGKGNGATPFNRIEDKNGKVLVEFQAPTEQSVNPEAVYELISIMTDDKSRQYIFGPKNPLTMPDRVVAAKTGTTQNWKDGWTLGFTPQLAVGVWAGNNNSSLMRAGADGVFVAAPMWQRFMIEAHAGQPALDFPVPPGIVQIAYDPGSNRPATQIGKNTRMEPFPWYALPKEAQISAAPKSLNKGLLIPVSEEAPKTNLPLTAPSNLPKPVPDPTTVPTSPPTGESSAPPPETQTTIAPLPSDYVDFGGLPNDYPTEPQAESPATRPRTL